MKKIVIFDLDGTLSDSISSMKYCADRALAAVGLGPFTEDEYKIFVGDGAETLIERALTAAGDTGWKYKDVVYPLYLKYFAKDCMYGVKPYDEIPELIAKLKEQGIRIAVLSNKPHLQTIDVIVSLFGEGCFDCILGQRDGYPVKPDPCGVFEILRQMKLKPEDVLYLGDTATDMKTGKAAGAFTVGALWGFRDRKELENGGADVVISHPLEVLDYLA